MSLTTEAYEARKWRDCLGLKDILAGKVPRLSQVSSSIEDTLWAQMERTIEIALLAVECRRDLQSAPARPQIAADIRILRARLINVSEFIIGLEHEVAELAVELPPRPLELSHWAEQAKKHWETYLPTR